MKIVFLIFVCSAVFVHGRVAPDSFPRCRRSDPHIEKCVLEGIEKLRPELLQGISQLNVPGIDPFNVPTLKLDRTAPNLRIKAVIKNMKAYGGRNFKLEKLKLNLNNKYVGEAKLVLPFIHVAGEYDVRGSRLLVLEIDGKGKMRSNFTGITVVAKGSAKPVDRDGVQYLQVDKIVTKVKVGHGQVAFDETERPLAAASAATFFNANPQIVLDILSPLIEETGASVFKAFFNKFLGSIPLNELLIDE